MRAEKSIPWITVVYVLGLSPLVVLLWDSASRHLGPDWVGEATRRSGRYALAFLLLSLTPGAIWRLTGLAGVLRLGRPLGLLAFFHSLVHMLAFVGLDYRFNAVLLWADVPHNLSVLVGTAALLILVPLAATSTNGSVRRLGGNWKRLHRLVYLAAAAAILHSAWRSKEMRIGVLWIAALLMLLMLARLLPAPRKKRDGSTRGEG